MTVRKISFSDIEGRSPMKTAMLVKYQLGPDLGNVMDDVDVTTIAFWVEYRGARSCRVTSPFRLRRPSDHDDASIIEIKVVPRELRRPMKQHMQF
jgi:hypothetical protein